MKPGLIYVYRYVAGKMEALPLENQASFREWAGCFSAIVAKGVQS